jgi:polysaccharide export outer membrane protein
MARKIVLAVLLAVSAAAYAQQPAGAAAEKKYSVVGEITHPGNYALKAPTKVLQALVFAGGFKDYADTTKIVVKRGDKSLEFNYQEVIKGKALEQNVLLEPGDVIVVK